MRIISYNVNGLRAAMKKGFADWLKTNPADIICLQETKATAADIDVKEIEAAGYAHYWFSAKKKGYSGVAVLTRIKPDRIENGNGHGPSDEEGRVIQIDIKDVRVINAYFPSGTSGKERQQFKYRWLDEFYAWIKKLKKKYPKMILCGDYNIAHKEIDIHDPKGNKNSSGFLPEERAWLSAFFESGWVDTFRVFHPEPHRYSWWSQRFPSVREQNKGWRIDYIAVTEALRPALRDADIFPDIKHSDHCPVYAELAL
ncbi:MAG: exodeoxyribonuclease III [Chitinophagaceae bacterium]|nr:exodeoxyribonuclease III [Chitinophagaceae bacterium]